MVLPAADKITILENFIADFQQNIACKSVKNKAMQKADNQPFA